MTVLRSIRVLGEDNQTEILQLNMQEGGAAAEMVCPQDWRTPQELQDISTACLHMIAVIQQYQSETTPPTDTAPTEGGV